MTDPRSVVRARVGDHEYRLHMGMSVLAQLQSQHGQNVLSEIDAEAPNLDVIVDLMALCLQRYHPDADTYLADDLLAENPGLLRDLMQAFAGHAESEGESESGNAPRPRRKRPPKGA